jgi:hypothetical protein
MHLRDGDRPRYIHIKYDFRHWRTTVRTSGRHRLSVDLYLWKQSGYNYALFLLRFKRCSGLPFACASMYAVAHARDICLSALPSAIGIHYLDGSTKYAQNVADAAGERSRGTDLNVTSSSFAAECTQEAEAGDRLPFSNGPRGIIFSCMHGPWYNRVTSNLEYFAFHKLEIDPMYAFQRS